MSPVQHKRLEKIHIFETASTIGVSCAVECIILCKDHVWLPGHSLYKGYSHRRLQTRKIISVFEIVSVQ